MNNEDKIPVAVRLTRLSDIPTVMRIFDAAKMYMRASGNMEQWVGGYPAESDILADIDRGYSFIIELAGSPVGTFCLMTAPEPTYAVIDGAWLGDTPYVTLHRVASDGSLSGIFHIACMFAAQLGKDIRVDTHAMNLPMQRAVLREGFTYCGIITLRDGSPRLAYQLRY